MHCPCESQFKANAQDILAGGKSKMGGGLHTFMLDTNSPRTSIEQLIIQEGT
jgi:hypothetical protein